MDGDVAVDVGRPRASRCATAIGLGLSGVPYVGSDTGGFSGAPSPELYLRWLELPVLMPFCRTHSTARAPNREPWRFDEPYRTAIGRLIRFRYRVLPYLYTLADEVSRHGQPMVRPLCWPAVGRRTPARPSTAASGPSTTRTGSATRCWSRRSSPTGPVPRSVPLPAGRWYRWRALPAMGDDRPFAAVSAVVDGGRTVDVDTPAGQPTVLVRGGSIVPLDDGWSPDGRFSDGRSPDGRFSDDGALAAGHEPRLLAVHCFPDAAGEAVGTAYDDAGDGFGPYRRDQFRLATVVGDRGDAPAETVLTWARDGTYPAPDRLRVVVYGIAAARAFADGREIPCESSGRMADCR